MRFYIYIILIFGIAACNYDSPEVAFEEMHLAFEKEYLKRFSIHLTEQGHHEAYPLLYIPNLKDSIDNELFLRQALTNYEQVEYLNNEKRAVQDSMILFLKNELTSTPYLNKSLQSNPQIYDVLRAFDRILNDKRLSQTMRLKYINVKLDNLEHFYEIAKLNLNKPARDKVDIALERLPETYFFFANTLPESIDQSDLSPRVSNPLLKKIERAKWCVKDYIAFCNSLKHERLVNSREAKGKRVLVQD